MTSEPAPDLAAIRERDALRLRARINLGYEPSVVEQDVAHLLTLVDALRPMWATFLEQVDEWEFEIETDPLWEAAIGAGLAERVPYNPKVHGEMDCEPGDEIIATTKLGAALARLAPRPADVEPDDIRCERSGVKAISGRCPQHGGDACLVWRRPGEPGEGER